MTATHRILGIDPGSRQTGWGVIEVGVGNASCIAHGVVQAGTGAFPERLGIIFEGLCGLIDTHRPAEVAVETVFMNRNANSALKLGQARGAAITAAISCRLPVAEYPPATIKQALVGRGGADKVQVQHMVAVLLGLKTALQADAADALAVALCHHHTMQTVARVPALRDGR